MKEPAKLANALTIDVEEHFQVAAFKHNINPDDWCSHGSRVERNTHQFLDIVDEHSVKATFFFLGWVAERHPQLVREVIARGHEVGSHGYSHQLIYEQSIEVF